MPKKPTHLLSTLYAYVKPINRHFARTTGKQLFGSSSAYIDHLIAEDRRIRLARAALKKPA